MMGLLRLLIEVLQIQPEEGRRGLCVPEHVPLTEESELKSLRDLIFLKETFQGRSNKK